MKTMQLSNLGPLIRASEIWAETPSESLWLENDHGKMKLSTTRPTNFFAKLAKVEILAENVEDTGEILVEVEWPSGRHQLIIPPGWEEGEAPYEGRPYSLGEMDCYSLVRDWMGREKGIQMDPITDSLERLSNELLTDGAFITNSEVGRWERVVIPQPGDGILFAMTQNDPHSAGVANHSGIYLGDGRFLHHFANRLSCEERLDEFWKSRVASFMRHKHL
jgi:hypothetical protein